MSDDFLARLQRAERRDDARLSLAQRKYTLLGPLSSGAFSNVYRAKRAEDDLGVAVKVFKRHEEALSTFEHEVNAYSLIFDEKAKAKDNESSHVISLVDAFRANRVAWLVLELGQTSLRHHMRRVRDMRSISTLIRQLVHGVRHVHAYNIAHRDLKPENLLVCRGGALKICDFGMARLVEGRLHTVCGTPQYMSPELFRRSKEGYRGRPVDVWAIGAIAYELVHNGTPAFSANSMRELVGRIRRGAHNALRVNLPLVYRRLIQRCFELNPDVRHTSEALPIPRMKSPVAVTSSA